MAARCTVSLDSCKGEPFRSTHAKLVGSSDSPKPKCLYLPCCSTENPQKCAIGGLEDRFGFRTCYKPAEETWASFKALSGSSLKYKIKLIFKISTPNSQVYCKEEYNLFGRNSECNLQCTVRWGNSSIIKASILQTYLWRTIKKIATKSPAI